VPLPPTFCARRFFPVSLLLRSAVWFCRLRWIAVVVVLLVFGILGLFPTWLPRIGLRAHTEWPFGAAAVQGASCRLAGLPRSAQKRIRRLRTPDPPV